MTETIAACGLSDRCPVIAECIRLGLNPSYAENDSSRAALWNKNDARTGGGMRKTDRAWEAAQASADVKGNDYALFVGDSLRVLKNLPSEAVSTCLTSPPYWGARDYEHDDQIGLEETIEEYVGRLADVFDEVKRILKPRGTAWLNLGDCYLHGVGTIGGKPPKTGYRRNKQLALIPFRVALALQERGWWVRNTLVWQKTNAMPASVRDRLTNTWEPVFLLAKSEDYFFNLDAVRVPHRTSDAIERLRAEKGANGKAKGKNELRRWLNSPRHRATIEGLREIRRRPNAPEAIELAAYLRRAAERKGLSIKQIARQMGQPFERIRHYFRTDEIGSRVPPEETWEELKELLDLGTEFDDAMSVEVRDNVFRNHPKGRNPGDVASFAVAPSAATHFATMPQSLADWLLSATLEQGETCLDPFMGVGTTGLSALRRGGRFIGMDIHRHYLKDFVRLAGGVRAEMAEKVVALRA